MRALILSEAAIELRKSRRWLQTWLSLHPADAAGVPFYAPFGRTKTFDDSDLRRLQEAIDSLDRRPTFTYFAEAVGHIKIGKAGNWKKRLSGIQSPLPVKLMRLLVLRSHVGYEADLHEKFAAFRARGEWFKDCSKLREFIADAAKKKHLVVAGAE
jgi:hypothetical protein